MSNNDETEKELTTSDEAQEAPKRKGGRAKTNRASNKSSGGDSQPAPKKTPDAPQTSQSGKPIRKTASGFTVVG